MKNSSCTKVKRSSEMDLTDGNLFWKIPKFALPMAFTTILQLLYTTVDLFTVSKFGGGNNSMSAVGSNTPLINLIVTFFVSFSIGANVVMGNAKGAKDKDRALKILNTSMILSLISGFVVGIVGFFISPYMLKWMNTPEGILTKSTEYLQIYFLGLPFLMVYNYGSQILRALGDSKRPLYILIISGLINVACDFLFVIVFKLDVIGVAWATVLSEVVSAVLIVLWLILNKKAFVRLNILKMKIDRSSMSDILKIGIPSGLQGLGYCIPNVMIQSSLYSITDYQINGTPINIYEIVAGSSASSTIENYVFAFVDAFASAITAFVGQNYGANNKTNIKKTFVYAIFWSLVTWGICSFICCVFPNQVLSVFITEGDNINYQNALMAGKERMIMMVLTYSIDTLMDLSSAYLRGMKHSLAPSINTITCCVGLRIFFLVVLFPLPTFHTIFWLYFVYPLSWTLSVLIFIPLIIIIQKKVFKEIDERTKGDLKVC